MKNLNRFNFGQLVALLATLLMGQNCLAQAQVPQSTQNPLVTQNDTSHSTVWQLVLPMEPGEKTRLSRKRMEYGLSILQLEDGPQLRQFIQAFIAEVQPPNAWQKAESLVIRFTNDRVETDPLPQADVHLNPSNIHIINTPEELLKNFSLRPEEMNAILWSKDPVGPCKITTRTDILKNIANIEAHIDQIHKDDPAAAIASKQALRACVAQNGDNLRCSDRYVKDIMYIQRNKGANSVGENEAYDLKTTNVPNARVTVYWNDYLKTFEGVGWECCGNPLQFYTNTFFMGSLQVGSTPPVVPKNNLSCELSANGIPVKQNIVLNMNQTYTLFGKAVGATGGLEVASTRWILNNAPVVGNEEQFTINPGSLGYKTGSYNGAFEVVDQFGRVTSCPFSFNLKPVPPPTVTTAIPPRPPAKTLLEPPPTHKHGGCGKGCIIGILVGVAAAGAAVALLSGGHGSSSTKNPGTPAGAGINP